MYKRLRTQIFKLLFKEHMDTVITGDADDNYIVIRGSSEFQQSDHSRHNVNITVIISEEVK